MTEEKPIGALWKKKDKFDNTFFSGEIDIDGTLYKITLFKNKYCIDEAKHPYMRIYKAWERSTISTKSMDEEFSKMAEQAVVELPDNLKFDEPEINVKDIPF